MSTGGTETSSRAGREGIGGGREVEEGSGRCSEGAENSQKLNQQMLVLRLWEALGGTESEGISSISLINLLDPGTGEGDKGVDGWTARGQGEGTRSSDASMTFILIDYEIFVSCLSVDIGRYANLCSACAYVVFVKYVSLPHRCRNKRR